MNCGFVLWRCFDNVPINRNVLSNYPESRWNGISIKYMYGGSVLVEQVVGDLLVVVPLRRGIVRAERLHARLCRCCCCWCCCCHWCGELGLCSDSDTLKFIINDEAVIEMIEKRLEDLPRRDRQRLWRLEALLISSLGHWMQMYSLEYQEKSMKLLVKSSTKDRTSQRAKNWFVCPQLEMNDRD